MLTGWIKGFRQSWKADQIALVVEGVGASLTVDEVQSLILGDKVDVVGLTLSAMVCFDCDGHLMMSLR